MFFNGFKIKIFLLKLGHRRLSDKIFSSIINKFVLVIKTLLPFLSFLLQNVKTGKNKAYQKVTFLA